MQNINAKDVSLINQPVDMNFVTPSFFPMVQKHICFAGKQKKVNV